MSAWTLLGFAPYTFGFLVLSAVSYGVRARTTLSILALNVLLWSLIAAAALL